MRNISDQGRLRPWMGFTLFAVLMVFFILVCVPLQMRSAIPGLIITELSFAAIAVLYCFIRKVKIKEVFPVRKPSAKDIFGCLLLLAGGFCISMISVSLTAAIFPGSASEASDLSSMIYGKMGYIPTVLVIALMPAVCEEAIHRGAILSNFRSIKKDWIIVLIMAALFGLNHCSVLRFAATASLGAILSYVVVKKDNILLSMMMHFTNNLVSATAGYFAAKNPGLVESSAQSLSSYLGVYLLLGFAAPLFIALGMMLLDPKKDNKRRFAVAGILTGIMLISGIGLTLAGPGSRVLLNSTISYRITEDTMDSQMLDFNVEEDTNATVAVILTNAEGDYRIRIDGDKGSNIINAPVPHDGIRMFTYNVGLAQDHYTVTLVAEENAIGEQPQISVTVR